MLSFNSPYPKNNNKSSYTLKSSFCEKIKDIPNNLFNEISFKTPIKEINNLIDNNNSSSPFNFNFTHYSGNFYSQGTIKTNPINNPFNSFITSPNKNKLLFDNYRENSLNRKTIESPIFKVSPEFMKENINNNLFNVNGKKLFSSERQMKIISDNINEKELNKKNLCILFNDINNDNPFFFVEEKSFENKVKTKGKGNLNENDSNKNCFKFEKIPKKLFECSGSGSKLETYSLISTTKKKRLRKNEKQLFLLKKFYSEHKQWNKKELKEISNIIGIKENKVYKWLWDQRNKETKNSKFIINKQIDIKEE